MFNKIKLKLIKRRNSDLGVGGARVLSFWRLACLPLPVTRAIEVISWSSCRFLLISNSCANHFCPIVTESATLDVFRGLVDALKFDFVVPICSPRRMFFSWAICRSYVDMWCKGLASDRFVSALWPICPGFVSDRWLWATREAHQPMATRPRARGAQHPENCYVYTAYM